MTQTPMHVFQLKKKKEVFDQIVISICQAITI